jgi:hypothetical protein
LLQRRDRICIAQRGEPCGGGNTDGGMSVSESLLEQNPAPRRMRSTEGQRSADSHAKVIRPLKVTRSAHWIRRGRIVRRHSQKAEAQRSCASPPQRSQL